MSGDPMRLQQVISNLLSNAIKFTDTGCIVLHVQCAGIICRLAFATLERAKEVLRLFDPFFRGDRRAAQFSGHRPWPGDL